MLKLICRMAIFMLCAQAIVHFRPNRSYEKYLRLLAGMMVLVQLFLAGILILKRDVGESFEERVKYFSEKLNEEMNGQRMEKIKDAAPIVEEVERVQSELYEVIKEDEEDAGKEIEIDRVQDVEINVQVESAGGRKQ